MKYLSILIIALFVMPVQGKIQAQSGMDQILSLYKDFKKKYARQSAHKDISLACMGIVYLDWFTMYHNAIAQTPKLSKSELSTFPKFEKTAVVVETRDFDAYDIARDGMISNVGFTRDEMQEAGKLTPAVSKLSLDNIQQENLVANLKDCINPEFVSLVDQRSPLLISPEFEITLRPVQIKHGLMPISDLQYINSRKLVNDIVKQKSVEDDDPFSEKTQSYEHWLNEIERR